MLALPVAGLDSVEAGLGSRLGQWLRGYSKGAAAGPAGNARTDGACSTIPLCEAVQNGELERVRELM